ncbi:MAG: response regulator [Acidaminobacteraceae bacterium]
MNKIKKFNLNILYVEDDIDLCEELGAYIKRRVKNLWIAKNGVEALELYHENRPDIIITDLKMPFMTGVELAEKIRSEDLIIPIIITTALSDVESIMDSVNLGIDKYLIKPINMLEFNLVLKLMEEKISEIKLLNNKKFDITYDETIYIEKEIQTHFAKYMKLILKKGPQKIQCKIKGAKLQIQIMGSRTSYEETLSSKVENILMLNSLRKSFYTMNTKKIEKIIKECSNLNLKLQSIEVDSNIDIDILEFEIKEYFREKI